MIVRMNSSVLEPGEVMPIFSPRTRLIFSSGVIVGVIPNRLAASLLITSAIGYMSNPVPTATRSPPRATARSVCGMPSWVKSALPPITAAAWRVPEDTSTVSGSRPSSL
jgi:hypothetical protein